MGMLLSNILPWNPPFAFMRPNLYYRKGVRERLGQPSFTWKFGEKMIIKLYWERCAEFVMDEQDGYLIEATPAETLEFIVPALNPHERLKFESMKDIYIAKPTNGTLDGGCFYFLVSRDGQAVKFESRAILTTDLSSRGGKISPMPDIPIARLEDVCTFVPSA
jgi:hypothetical protein